MLNHKVWILVLGAGFSSRMGKQKLLLPIYGEPMIRHVAEKSLTTIAAGVVVVVNDTYIDTQNAILNLPVVPLVNPEAHMGMSTSLRLGIRYLQLRAATAAVILLADQPAVDRDTIDRVIREHLDRNVKIVQTYYQDGPGHPVLFCQSLFDELLEIKGDKGARNILARYSEHIHKVVVPTACPIDIDTQADYELFLKQSQLYKKYHS